jgi:iron complex transport system permease protein
VRKVYREVILPSVAPERAGRRSAATVLILLFLAVTLAFLVYVGVGSFVWYTPAQVLAEILRGPFGETGANDIVWRIRLPRAVQCVLIGASLGAVGSAFQALLRNPLAEPYIVGVSSGAAVGATVALVGGFAGAFFGLAMVGSGFVGGLLALALVFGLTRRRGRVDVTTLLLAGVVVGALLGSLLSLMLLMAGHDTNRILRWLLGSITPASWAENAILTGTLLIGGAILVANSRRLNAFALGEDTAQRLGVDVGRLMTVVLVTGTAMTAAAVGAAGIIGFVGLVAPHIARGLVGVDWRRSLPGALLVGAVLLLGADLIAQRGIGLLTGEVGMDVPVGIVTAVLGAPWLLVLLRRNA